jgi:hypothetical protein
MARPVGVVVSIASVSDRNFTADRASCRAQLSGRVSCGPVDRASWLSAQAPNSLNHWPLAA